MGLSSSSLVRNSGCYGAPRLQCPHAVLEKADSFVTESPPGTLDNPVWVVGSLQRDILKQLAIFKCTQLIRKNKEI